MDFQGGGATYHEGCNTYVDLVVSDISSIEGEYAQIADLFLAFGKHRQGNSNFGYAEIAKDNRLYELLRKTYNGQKFYEHLVTRIPAITVSDRILGDASNTSSVKIFSLSEMNQDPLATLNKVYDVIRKNKKDTEEAGYIVDRL
jgi:hypothetical protein